MDTRNIKDSLASAPRVLTNNEITFSLPPLDRNKLYPIVDQLDFSKTSGQSMRDTRAIVAAHFSVFLDILAQHIPTKKNTLNVLSLACGSPDDYLALKAFMQTKNSSCQIKYVGIDIDEENNAITRSLFGKIAEVSIITGDASQNLDVLNALHNKLLLPKQGFDLIFLRHPDILSPQRGPIFKRMLQEVIPLVSANNAPIFISTYFLEELQAVNASLNPAYYLTPRQNYVQSDDKNLFTDCNNGERIYPHQHNFVTTRKLRSSKLDLHQVREQMLLKNPDNHQASSSATSAPRRNL